VARAEPGGMDTVWRAEEKLSTFAPLVMPIWSEWAPAWAEYVTTWGGTGLAPNCQAPPVSNPPSATRSVHAPEGPGELVCPGVTVAALPGKPNGARAATSASTAMTSRASINRVRSSILSPPYDSLAHQTVHTIRALL